MMIFTSQEAHDRWLREYTYGRVLHMHHIDEWCQSAVMCDGDVRKPVRMRQYANKAFEALDKLNDECDEEFVLDSCSKEKWDLGMDIDELATKIRDVIIRLEALE